jgi:hypothetical protein
MALELGTWILTSYQGKVSTTIKILDLEIYAMFHQ